MLPYTQLQSGNTPYLTQFSTEVDWLLAARRRFAGGAAAAPTELTCLRAWWASVSVRDFGDSLWHSGGLPQDVSSV